MTVRRRIMAELEKGPMTARELSKTVRISEKDVVAHLEHVARSVQPPKRFFMEPAACHKCGFIFSDRKRYSIPSRCPQCHHEGISPPAFRIEGP